jgi:hypothetical protein
VNPLTKLWKTFSSSQIFVKKILEYIKLAELVIVQVIGSVEDERCFSTLTFMKTKLQNILTTHVELVIWIFSQKFFTFRDFPFGEAIQNWKDNKTQYGV